MSKPQGLDPLLRPKDLIALGEWTDPTMQERFRVGVSAILSEHGIEMRQFGTHPIIQEPELFRSAIRPLSASGGRHALRVAFRHGQQRFLTPSTNVFGLELICATTHIDCQSAHVMYDGREQRWYVHDSDRKGIREPRPRLSVPAVCRDLEGALSIARTFVNQYLAEPEKLDV